MQEYLGNKASNLKTQGDWDNPATYYKPLLCACVRRLCSYMNLCRTKEKECSSGGVSDSCTAEKHHAAVPTYDQAYFMAVL